MKHGHTTITKTPSKKKQVSVVCKVHTHRLYALCDASVMPM